MKTVAAKLYEGMFLVDSALAASDWQGINDTIKSILARVDAQIVSIDKWDERRLAYDIRGKSRGTYILAYFRVDGPKVTEIERLANLNENIVRVLILNVEDLDEKYITKSRIPQSEDDTSQAPAAAGQSQPRPVGEQEKESAEEPLVGADDEKAPDEEEKVQDTMETDIPAEGEEDKEQ